MQELLQGKIMKGIGGFYYVHVPEAGLYECRAKGIFRNRNVKPLPGDNVEIECIDSGNLTGNIVEIYERRNALIRPAAANVDQSMVVFAVAQPKPNLNLLDRFLIRMEQQRLPVILCLNKLDLMEEAEFREAEEIYQNCGYPVLSVSMKNGTGLSGLRQYLSGKTTVLAGPSGVGKSSLVNALIPEAEQETGRLSEKIKRGRHTTRHTEILCLDEKTYIMDTPGFSSLDLNEYEKEELKSLFPEFIRYEEECRFQGCVHIGERECGVKQAVKRHEIAESRYENYVMFYEEVKQKKLY